MTIQRKRVAKRLASGLLAGALALGGLAISGGTASAKLPSSPSTNRIYGADRYETSVAIARNQMGLTTPTGLVIASGEVVADALAAAPLTSATRPMLLVRKDSVPTAVADFLADVKAGMSIPATSVPVYVVGGENVISKEVFDAIKAAVTLASDTTPPTVTRISGADRYATAKAISEVTGVTGATDKLFIVNGEDGKWADALSAGRFSSANGWPIVLVKASGMEASGQAQIDAYLARTGSVKQFVIVGGPASVPTSVEDYLVGTKLVPVANIARYGGADRYQTNYLIESTLGSASAFNVALASGQAPYDALAAAAWAATKNVHLILTPTAGGSPFAAGVAGAGDLFARLADSTAPGVFGANLYIIGGRAAVSDAAKAGYLGVATASDLTVESLTGCFPGSKSLTMVLSGSLTTLEAASTSGIQAPSSWTVNNTAVAAGRVTVSAINLPGSPLNKTFSVSLADGLPVAGSVKFVGWTQGSAVGGSSYVAQRNIASSTCTVTPDLTRPTITMRAISGTTVGATTSSAKILVSSSKPVSILEASLSAGTIKANSFANAQVPTVTALDTSNKQFLITLAGNETLTPVWATLGATPALVSVSTAAIVDLASGLNPLAAEAYGEFDTSAAKPVIAGARCFETSWTKLAAGSLVFEARGGSANGGASESLYTLVVVNQRGLNIPTVTVDSTAQRITVTADIGYHTTADIAQIVNNTYGNGLDPVGDTWVVTGASSSTRPSATVVPATSTSLGSSAGVSTCEVLLTSSEPFFLVSTGAAVALNGLSSAYFPVTKVQVSAAYNPAAITGVAAQGTAYAKLVQFTTPYLGTGTMSFSATAGGLYDINGNAYLGSIDLSVTSSGGGSSLLTSAVAS